MDDAGGSTEAVAQATAAVLQNSAIHEAVLVFGKTRVLLSKGQNHVKAETCDTDIVTPYPEVETSLVDDSSSWLR